MQRLADFGGNNKSCRNRSELWPCRLVAWSRAGLMEARSFLSASHRERRGCPREPLVEQTGSWTWQSATLLALLQKARLQLNQTSSQTASGKCRGSALEN